MFSRLVVAKVVLLTAAGLVCLGSVNAARACTGIQLTASDGTVIHARTLEFGVDLESNVLFVPRGYARVGATPEGDNGLRWTTKYASVGPNGVGVPYLFDGLNEKGLAVGTFYFPNSPDYPPYEKSKADKTLASWEVNSWILENFATVDEVKAAVDSIVVPAVVFKAWNYALPLHYIVHDASGQCIVIEPCDGRLKVFDNPLGVLTNSPTFDWHMTNLRNYVNLSPTNLPSKRLGSVLFNPTGQGSGMLGMPGDYTPPSRFVRAVMFSKNVYPVKTGREVVLQAFHILNNFDIPDGVARDRKKDVHGNPPADYTQWTSVNDLKAKRFYFKTHKNNQIRVVDLMKMDLDAKQMTTISMQAEQKIESATP